MKTLIRDFKWQPSSSIASGCFLKRVARTSSSLQQRNWLLLRGCWMLTGQKQVIVFLLCWYLGYRGEARCARPQMIEHLNSLRDFFEELSPELGVIDPVLGPVVTRKS